jgi:hypothetical protein
MSISMCELRYEKKNAEGKGIEKDIKQNDKK